MQEGTINPFNVFQERVVIAMVGLPARGKSFLSKGILRYMKFLGCETRVFNAGNYRRQQGLAGTDASFFDANNQEAAAMREEMAMTCLDDLLQWLSKQEGCAIGLFDATNTTVARRRKLKDRCEEQAKKDGGIKLIFIESIADDPDLLEQSYRLKLSNGDYAGRDRTQAYQDFCDRVKKYEEVYEPISDELDGVDTRYLKMVNAGQKLISNNFKGFVLQKIQRFLGSVHLRDRIIWLVLVGETENDLSGILGGDPNLSKEGLDYSNDVCRIICERGSSSEENSKQPLLVYTGSSRRYVTMARALCDQEKSRDRPCQMLTLTSANDLCSGVMDSMSDKQREENFPEEIAARAADKLGYRYPGVGGESYADLIARSNELICHLEQTSGDSVVICDRSMFRAVMGYFMGKSIEEVPDLDVQPGILEMRRNHAGFEASHIQSKIGRATSSAGAGSKPYVNSRTEKGSLFVEHQGTARIEISKEISM